MGEPCTTQDLGRFSRKFSECETSRIGTFSGFDEDEGKIYARLFRSVSSRMPLTMSSPLLNRPACGESPYGATWCRKTAIQLRHWRDSVLVMARFIFLEPDLSPSSSLVGAVILLSFLSTTITFVRKVDLATNLDTIWGGCHVNPHALVHTFESFTDNPHFWVNFPTMQRT